MFIISQYFFGFSNNILVILTNKRTKIDIKHVKCIFKLNLKKIIMEAAIQQKKIMNVWVGL